MARRHFITYSVIVFSWAILFCGSDQHQPTQSEKATTTMDQLAEKYVRLGLQLGQSDANYVDAYYGPESWRPDSNREPIPLPQINSEAEQLLAQIQAYPQPVDAMSQKRKLYLDKQVTAMIARVAMLEGHALNFDEEAQRVYDAKPPTFPVNHFEALIAELEGLIPGEGPLRDRLQAFRNQFVIPANKLDTVFQAAITEARTRTATYLDLPDGENFKVAYVTDKPWSGYNWYQGKFTSLIQVNTDLPITIDRAIDLACHEGYPGHHVYNVLLEKHLVGDKGWQEFAFYPLFSPQSLIAEGTANYGIRTAFSHNERIEFEQKVLFPLAGLDPSQAPRYYQVMALLDRLKYAGNEAARKYLNGEIDANSAITWLRNYALMSEAKAQQRISFFETYRAYVINYNLGEDLVANYISAQGGDDNVAARWRTFQTLLSAPWVPSLLSQH